MSGSDLVTAQHHAPSGQRRGKVYFGHDAGYIAGADVVVTSTAVKADNPEVLAAGPRAFRWCRAMMLAELMR